MNCGDDKWYSMLVMLWQIFVGIKRKHYVAFFQPKETLWLLSSLRWIFDYTFFWYMANKKHLGLPQKQRWRKQQGAFRTQFAQNINQSVLAFRDCAFLLEQIWSL